MNEKMARVSKCKIQNEGKTKPKTKGTHHCKKGGRNTTKKESRAAAIIEHSTTVGVWVKL